jgi:hypothetical protein
VIEQLSAFEFPSGFAAGVNSVTAGLNARKEFLAESGVLNKVGVKQDGVTVTDDGELLIGGVPLVEINATLAEHDAGELTLVPTAAFRRALGTTYPALSRTNLKLINSAPVPRLLGDKGLQYWELSDTQIPVPPWQPLGHYVRNGVTDFDALVSDFIEGAPLVLKGRNSTHGVDIWFYPDGAEAFVDDWRNGTAPEPFLAAPSEFLLQFAIPHVYDKRVIAAGPRPVAGENRYGRPDTDKSNLTLVETAGETKLESARELLAMNAVEPLDIGDLDPAVERAVADLYELLDELAETDTGDLHTWIGWDFLVVDPTDPRLDIVPNDVLTGLFRDQYRTEDGCYLVFGEGNLSPGSLERYVNALAHGRSGLRWDSAANLLAYGTSISNDEPFEPRIPDPLDRETLADRYELTHEPRQHNH